MVIIQIANLSKCIAASIKFEYEHHHSIDIFSSAMCGSSRNILAKDPIDKSSVFHLKEGEYIKKYDSIFFSMLFSFC